MKTLGGQVNGVSVETGALAFCTVWDPSPFRYILMIASNLAHMYARGGRFTMESLMTSPYCSIKTVSLSLISSDRLHCHLSLQTDWKFCRAHTCTAFLSLVILLQAAHRQGHRQVQGVRACAFCGRRLPGQVRISLYGRGLGRKGLERA